MLCLELIGELAAIYPSACATPIYIHTAHTDWHFKKLCSKNTSNSLLLASVVEQERRKELLKLLSKKVVACVVFVALWKAGDIAFLKEDAE